jgi:uncharacterized membrane protein YkvA (DUF1232 family)
MAKKGSITFEQAKERAADCIDCEGRIAKLLSKAVSKAERNHEFLLTPWESIHILLRMARAQLTGRYSPPFVTIFAAIAALIYFVEPFDVIPDHVPVFGLLDDTAVITAVVRANLHEIMRFRKWECS